MTKHEFKPKVFETDRIWMDQYPDPHKENADVFIQENGEDGFSDERVYLSVDEMDAMCKAWMEHRRVCRSKTP